jgi:hypothetical protein
MCSECLQKGSKIKQMLSIRSLCGFLAPRAYSIILLAALFCTLAVKFYHSWRYGLVNDYIGWVLADISFLLGIEVISALICFAWPRKVVIRLVTVVAAVICTWSVMNAGWLIRTGTQILPRVLLPLVRAPLNSSLIVGVNLAKMPIAAVLLLVPSAFALAFFFFALANPESPGYNHKRFTVRITCCCVVIILTTVAARSVAAGRGSPQIASVGLRYNCQLRAVKSLVMPDYRRLPSSKREIPSYEQLTITLKPQHTKHNVVMVVLEGIQYQYTSLADKQNNPTP